MNLNERERAQLQKNFHLRQKVVPHPDGQPWDKCCRAATDNEFGCQCFTRKRKATGKSRYDMFVSGEMSFNDGNELDALIKNNDRFFCIHRTTEDGYYRECAGWYAKFGRKRHEKA